MAQDVKEKHKNCDECMEKTLFGKPDDFPTKIASLGFRVWFSWISIFVLGLTVKAPTTDSVISVLIFIVPLMREYCGFMPRTTARKMLRRIELVVIWIILGICVLNIVGILEISGSCLVVSDRFAVLSGISFNFIIVWFFLAITAILTIADYVAYRPKESGASKIGKKLMK